MSYVTRSTVLVALALVGAFVVPNVPASAAVHTTLPCEAIGSDVPRVDVIVLTQDVECDWLMWEIHGKVLDLNGHTVTVREPLTTCASEDIWFCDIDLGRDGVLQNGRVVGAGVGGGQVHDVTFIGGFAARIDGSHNEFHGTFVADGRRHERSLFIDSRLQHTGRLHHNALLRSRVDLANWTGYHGQFVDIVGNWLVESPVLVSVELNGHGDVAGVIDQNLLIRSRIGVAGVLGPTLGSFEITDNVVLGAPDTAISVQTSPPEFGPGGPLSVARNTIWFSRESISVNEPFVLGDMSGNRAIFSGRCQGVVCRPW